MCRRYVLLSGAGKGTRLIHQAIHEPQKEVFKQLHRHIIIPERTLKRFQNSSSIIEATAAKFCDGVLVVRVPGELCRLRLRHIQPALEHRALRLLLPAPLLDITAGTNLLKRSCKDLMSVTGGAILAGLLRGALCCFELG